MEIEKLLDELEDVLEASWRLPMSGGRSVVDTNDVKRILEDMRLKLPKEIVQAGKIIKERSQIFESAKNEVETMMKISEEKIKVMVSKSEVVKKAEATAENIILEANLKAKEIQKSANKYASDVMERLEQTLSANIAEIKKARQILQ